ncbi:Cellulase (glycosyl hydrolase family 5) [Candidatus Fervidibacteria bacterium JGI MDM2 JNZ-1-D12]
MRLLLLGVLGCVCLFKSAKAEVKWDFDSNGVLRIVSIDKSTLAQDLSAVIIKPGWQGSYADQLNPSTVKATQQRNGDLIWKGSLHGNGVSVVFIQRATVKGNELSLSYEFRSETEFNLETLMLRCLLPTEGNAGKAKWIAVDELSMEVLSGTFPEKLPERYHLLTKSNLSWLMWVLPSGYALLFDFREGNLVGVNLQDDRRFGINAFELQLHLLGGKWRVSEKVTSKLRLQVLTESEAIRWERQMQEAIQRQRTIVLQKHAPLKLNSVKPSTKSLRRYETLEVKVDLDATYDNPFDPEQISVEAEIVSPSGKQLRVPGFFTQDFERAKRDTGQGAREVLRKVGEPYFAVRFTPTEVGIYRYRIVATQFVVSHEAKAEWRNGTNPKATALHFVSCLTTNQGEKKQVSSDWFTLRVLPNPQAKGFVRRGKFWHLQFDDGTPFVPVGLNVCWSGNNLSAYERWFSAMRQNGANFARIWLVRWNMGLEWMPGDGSGMYLGLGKYALDNAWRIDELIRIAERNGIYLMLCLGYHGELADRQLYFGEQAWDKNPYNRKNGGPCDKPADFWTNPEARRFYKQRLRYIIARYAHSPNVLAFEFWNEVHAPADWVKEMAQFARSIDIYGHLLTTTYGDDAVWQLPEMDFAQTHWYGDGSQRDCVTTIVNIHRFHLQRYCKPFLLGEFGIDWRTSDLTYDPKGNALHWHNGVWASLMSGGMGTACVWYWDNYIDRLNLWHHFRPIADFVKLVGKAWLQNWRPLQHTDPILETPPEPPFGDLFFTPTLGWQRPTGDTFVVHRNGKVESNGETSVFLFSPSKPDLYRPPKFIVDFPQDGVMALHIGTVSSNAVLIVRIDGSEVWRQVLPEGEERKDERGRTYREGSYKNRRWDETWKKWDYIYEREFVVPIPEGKHTIELDNQGADWCTIPHIRFSPYRDRRYAEVDIVGIQTDTMALIWVHNQHSNFQVERDKERRTGDGLKPIRGLQFEVLGLKDGRYKIVKWDTWKGGIVTEWQANCRRGKLRLELQELNCDFALWIQHQ